MTNHVFGYEMRLADCRDEDIGTQGMFFEVGGSGMAIGDGSVSRGTLPQKKHACRFAHDQASA